MSPLPPSLADRPIPSSSSTHARPAASPAADAHEACQEHDGDIQEPASSFSGQPASLARPPPARLASNLPHLSPHSPLLLESLTVSALPSASLTESHTPWVDWSRPSGAPPASSSAPPLSKGPAANALAKQPVEAGSLSNTRPGPRQRKRSASVGSLQALMERDQGQVNGTAAGSPTSPRRRSAQLERPQPALLEEELADKERKGPEISQLSWGKWWPFAVVDPGSGKPASSEPGQPKKDAAQPARDFMSLFAGKQTVEHAREQHVVQAEQDRLEAELLDASLDELNLSVEADEIPADGLNGVRDKPLPPTPGRDSGGTGPFSLPSFFSSPKAAKPAPEAPSSGRYPPSSKSSTGPSLLSSFAVSNPFTSDSGPSRFFPSLGPSRSPPGSQARPFSTGLKSTEQRKQGDEAEMHPNDAREMLDDSDRESVEEGETVDDRDVFASLKDKYRTPKLPLVFCHGLFGFDYIGPANVKPLRFSYWIGVEEALQAMGVQVLIGRVPASASIEERAKVLCEMIGEKFPGQEVNLIGHSMGGLDGRFLISRLKPTNFRVRSLTTIATPHRGSSFADYLLEDIVGIERVPAMMTAMKALGVPGGGKAFDDLTTSKMTRFNEETPDDPNVRYFSYGAYFEPSWSNAFRFPWGVVYEREGANDGLVSVDSAKWGEYRATLENVNHLDLVGWIGKLRYSYAAWSGNDIKFRPVSFYCALAEQLADEGF